MEEVCLDDVQIVMKWYLASLIQEFDLIIPQRAKELEWVHNPFAVDIDALPESCQSITRFKEEFIDIQCDSSSKNIFKKGKLSQFWIKIKKRILLACMQSKLFCCLLPPVYMRVGFLHLCRSKQKLRTALSLKMT